MTVANEPSTTTTGAMFPAWAPKNERAKRRCAGECARTLPAQKYPTISARPGVRGGECRECRDRRLGRRA